MVTLCKSKPRIISITIVLLAVLINACTKNNDRTDNILGVTPFTVDVVQRNSTQAIIQWTESINLNINNSDTVKYKVIINNRIVGTNIIILRDTIDNISPDTTYNGRVLSFYLYNNS